MVYNFKGQVKVADVQKAFDDMIAKINVFRQRYEDALNSANYTLDTGVNTLAPNRYTLSVGGLKQIISDMQGQVVGCRVFKSGNTYFIGEGLVFTGGQVKHISQATLGGTGEYVILNTFNVPTRATSAGNNFVITKLNTQEGNGICEIVDAIADASDMKIFCGNNAIDRWVSQTRDASKDLFVSRTPTNNENGVQTVYFNGQAVSWEWRTTKHNGKQVFFYDHFFLPKNVPNPWTGTAETALKIFTPIIQ